MTDFEGQSILVTGAAGAIGSATARLFAERGAQVMLADVNGERLDAVVDLLGGIGAIDGVVSDLSQSEGAQKAVAATVERWGRIDGLFNNAGIAGAVKPVHELGDDEFDHVIATNLRSLFLTQKHAARAMIEADTPGAIVNMGSSMGGWDVLSGGAAYVTSKHGAIGLTKAAALDLGPYGIRVNAVCPGVIETTLGVPGLDKGDRQSAVAAFAERIPTRRIGQPVDVAEVVVFLASKAAAHISGAAWLIDGGQTLQSFSNGPADGVYPLLSSDPRR
ncbi:MAG: SDR family oxidoreductase [Roseitalea sp.]|jgi:NAD(P)-dependent dehydrogenase (short-subunit alcohol dehydrogenase family)|nr:SDR family oxidoreductase [Roseitalea sp.]MBO6741437.1 SDR family oxidoreductase [Roseitalea sp.]